MDIEVILNQQEIDRITESLDGPLAKMLLRRGKRVERKAKQLVSGDYVNVRTGRLRSSITTEITRGADGELHCSIGTDVYYAKYLHDGTRNADGTQRIRPRPFLRDALDAAE